MLPKIISDRKLFGELITGYRYRFLGFENKFSLQKQIPGVRELISDAITERFSALPEP